MYIQGSTMLSKALPGTIYKALQGFISMYICIQGSTTLHTFQQGSICKVQQLSGMLNNALYISGQGLAYKTCIYIYM